MSKHFTFDDYCSAYKFIDQARDKTMKVSSMWQHK